MMSFSNLMKTAARQASVRLTSLQQVASFSEAAPLKIGSTLLSTTTAVSSSTAASASRSFLLGAFKPSQARSLVTSVAHHQSIFTKKSDEGTDAKNDQAENSPSNGAEAAQETTQTQGDAEGQDSPVTLEQFQEIETKLNATIQESNDWKDKFARSLADMENLRKRTEKRVEDASHFAIQKFAKDILDVADVLQLAIDNVPEEKLSHETNPDLVDLFEGLKTTQKMLHSTFERHHVEQVYPLHQKFDPDFHEAVFEVPHEYADGIEHGHVHEVTKTGYTLRGRTIRPAAVGVVKKPQ